MIDSLGPGKAIADPPTVPRAAAERRRLFLALWPDAATRRRIARLRDAWAWPAGALPVRDDKLHLTLHFLGNLPAVPHVEQLAALVRDCEFAPFHFSLARSSLWRGGTAVAEPDGLPAPLEALHATLGAALQELGHRLDARAFRPHVSLARQAAQARPPAGFPVIEWQVERIALVESVLAPPTAYHVLARSGR